ncbi:MAG TPA: BTAD domain-containing putative transcriptional regulator [Chloroflexia bacterium]|nr:BTAD domain-containing putative transcriptional regulator [Chloroflexia bacterium]
MYRPLLTKINPPQARKLLRRARLLAQLEKSCDYNLTLVSAGTGFGKTSLLTDFARNSDLALAWYLMDESDRDPAVFCRYLLYSVRQLYPTFGSSFEELLEQNLKELHQESILFRLAEEFVSNLEQLKQEAGEDFRQTLLVLDDFQFAESFGVNRFVQRLIWWLPQSFHLIISTRSQPQDLMLTRLLAKQMITSLGPGDLAFTAQEVYELLQEFHGIEDEELAQALTAYSEGWITAIVLALGNQNLIRNQGWRSLQASPESFDAEELFNYLAQEVFENQSPEMQNFLVLTSVLNYVTPEACDKLLEISPAEAGEESEEYLRTLETRNLFITRLADNTTSYYQYHALFRQFLLAKLKRQKQLYKQACLKAAQFEKAGGFTTEAIQHYIEAGEVAEAAYLLNDIARSLYIAGRMASLASLLELIPTEAQSKLPHLQSTKAFLLLSKGDNEGALRAYIEAERLYQREQAFDLAARAATDQAQLLHRMGQRKEAFSICSRVLRDFSLLMQTVDGQYAIAKAKQFCGVIAMEEGNNAEAEKNLREASEIHKATGNELNQASNDLLIGQFHLETGHLVKSKIYLERALAYFVKIGHRSREAYCRTTLANNLYIQAQYQQAETQLNEALGLVQDLNDPFLRLYLLLYLGNVYRETERHGKADNIYAEAIELSREGHVRVTELALLNARVTNYIIEGKREEARSLIALTQELVEEYGIEVQKGFCLRNQGWLEYSNHSYKRALGYMERAQTIFESRKASVEEASIKLNKAIILLAMGEPRKAISVLNECFELCEELGFEPFLPLELRWASPLFEYASRKKVNEQVEEFLRRRGFISGFESPPIVETLPTIEESSSEYPEPIQLTQHLQKARQNNFAGNGAITPDKTDNILRIFALDGGRVWKGDVEIKQWRTSKAREALFFILDNTSCTRDQLWDALWPDESFETSPNLLNANLSNLRKAISPVELKLNAGRYFLEGEIWFDVAEFTAQLKTALAQQELNPERLTRALNLYKRDFLDNIYSNWSTDRQQQLLQLYIDGLEKLARYYQDHGQFAAAIPVWRQLLLKDNYNEEAHRACIACFIATGNKAEARRQSNQCLKALEELDLQPSHETTLLLRKLA